MALITAQNITLGFGSPPLLDQVNFVIEEKERICIIGRNGMGKSTLLRLLHGEIKADQGVLSLQPGLVTAALGQEVPDHIEGTIFDVIAKGLGEQGTWLSRFQQLSQQYSLQPDPAILRELENVQHALDKHHAWDLSPKIDKVISLLELSPDLTFARLSGGMKRRVMLGQALVKSPHILLLDEPTNHLDLDSITWLENFLLKFDGAVIFVSHDRSFLQKVATRFLEIDRGKLQSYPGDYTQYLNRKQHELEVEQQHNQLFDKKLAQEEAWIRQGIKARRTRNEGRVRALEQLREQRRARRELTGQANLQMQQAKLSGKRVIEANHITHGYGESYLIKDFSTHIIRGDKIGMIGPNGIGKSTLLKILLGQLKPLQGTIHHGTQLEIAYFDQLRAQLDEEKSVAENVSYGDQFIQRDGKSIHVIGYLQDFLFTPDRARSLVKSLSGGERNRLLLARLFSKPANLLVMDEPTNDLDMETLELLEELLINYEGTLLLISHDRQFLNNVVTSTLVFEGNGLIQEYVGGYEDWLRQRDIHTIEKSKPVPIPTPSKSTTSSQNPKALRQVEQQIEKQEALRAEIEATLADPSLYEKNKQKELAVLQEKLLQISKELENLYRQWEGLV